MNSGWAINLMQGVQMGELRGDEMMSVLDFAPKYVRAAVVKIGGVDRPRHFDRNQLLRLFAELMP